MTHTLHHLIKPYQAEALLKEYSTLIPGSALALLRSDGALFTATDTQDGEAIAKGVAADRTSALEGSGFTALPIYVGGAMVAFIAARSTAAALLPSLQSTFGLILQGNLEKREVARETLDRYREINLLYNIAETIGACLDPDKIPSLVLKESSRVIPADSGLVLLRDNQGEGALVQQATYPPSGEAPSAGTPVTVSNLLQSAAELVDQVMESGRPDIRSKGGAFASLMCAPLMARDRALGVLLLGRTHRSTPSTESVLHREDNPIQFTAGEEKLLMALASQAGIAIEKAWMHRQELQRQRLEHELLIGRRIQRSFLPEALPRLPGWEFASYYQAAREVGGDFYDFFEPINGDHAASTSSLALPIGLFIADVTGKGVPAALMMAFSRAMLRSLLHTGVQLVDKPSEIIQRLNTLLLRDNRTGLLLTGLYATLEPSSGSLRFTNAGHEWPFWLRATQRECVELPSHGTLLGAFRNLSLEEHQVLLDPGDQLVLYTDGATEARSPDGDLFGEQRLQDILETCLDASAEETAQTILKAVKAFSADAPQSDDITVVVIKRQAD